MSRSFRPAVQTVVLTVAALAASPGPGAAQQAVLEGVDVSPRIGRLAAAVDRGDSAEVIAFWRELERRGTPLVEPDTLNPGHSLVTFLYRASEDRVEVELESNIASLDPDARATSTIRLPLARIPGSDIRFLTFRLRNDVRAPYHLRIQRPGGEPERTTDPLNPAVWEPDQRALRASIVELAGALAQSWRHAGGEEGDWDELALRDQDGSERTVYVYKPPGWRAERDAPYPALVGLGAFGIGIGMRVDWMVDRLIADGRLPPIVVLLLDLKAASEAARYEPADAFVVEAVLPYAREHYRVSGRPEDIAVAGTSRRGMVAGLLALRRSDAVGNVLSLSGSYYWKPADAPAWVWVPAEYARTTRRPLRFYVAAGELETFVNPGNRGHYLVGTNRHLRDVLRSRGYDLTYVEFNGVHSELCWQDALADGLIHLFGSGR